MNDFLSILLLLLFVGFVSGCTKAQETTKILKQQGYTEIETTGYAWLSCSQDDLFRTKFTAISPAKKSVNGVMCCGFFKACTIRYGD